jgi:hypothetical protein
VSEARNHVGFQSWRLPKQLERYEEVARLLAVAAMPGYEQNVTKCNSDRMQNVEIPAMI